MLGVCTTSGPGFILKQEALGLAVMTELPLVVVDVQRVGPSTGMPTKTEQGDLLAAIYGRNSESPVAVLAASTPGDCFHTVLEAFCIAVKYMTPDLQILLLNNRVYGLTKGQYSPTSRQGMRSKSSPQGSIDHAIDPIAFALGAGATFVARTIDVDTPHLQQTLHRAHAHKGTSFVEILQNCPVYNDDEWREVEDRKTRLEAALVLEDDEPLVFGTKGGRRGIRIEDGVPSVVGLGDEDEPIAAGVAVHRPSHESPSYAFALASLARPQFPIPIGVIRSVEQPTYEAVLQDQIDDAIASRGAGDLAALLHSGDT